MAPSIEKEAEFLKEKAKKDLLASLESVRGKKNIVFSKSLTGPFGLFVGVSTLKEYGVEKIFVLENNNTDTSQRHIVYVLSSESASVIQAAATQIKRLRRESNSEHEITIIWTPRRTLLCKKILEDEGVLGDVNALELPLYFLPLEKDCLSLELVDSFTDLYLYHDPSSIFLASKALMQIQQRHGLFPRILGKGENSRVLANLLLRARKELDADEATTQFTTMPSTSIESLIIIDRDVDFATPLLTQLTYEGLVEELVGIKHNKAEVDTSIVGAVPQPRQAQSSSSTATAQPMTATQNMKRPIQLDSSDSLYEQIRSANFATVGPMLNKIARRLASESGQHQNKSIQELRELISRLPTMKQEHESLSIHTNLADHIMKHTRSETFNRELEVQQNIAAGSDPIYQHETVEELIARDASIETVLRLLCLESTFSGGLRPKDLESFKRQILQAYGYQHLLTLDNLEKMELLQSRSSAAALLLPVGGGGTSTSGTKTNYSYLRRELRLIIDEYNEQEPEDIAYVYSGYAPLSIRIIQCILQKQYLQSLHKSPLPLTSSSTGWAGFEDILKSAKGPTFNVTQKPSDEKAAKAKTALGGTAGWKTTFIMFLGGITHTEIAALRFISKQLADSGQRKRLVICTTSVISGRSIMDAVVSKRTLADGMVH